MAELEMVLAHDKYLEDIHDKNIVKALPLRK